EDRDRDGDRLPPPALERGVRLALEARREVAGLVEEALAARAALRALGARRAEDDVAAPAAVRAAQLGHGLAAAVTEPTHDLHGPEPTTRRARVQPIASAGGAERLVHERDQRDRGRVGAQRARAEADAGEAVLLEQGALEGR